MIEIKKMTQSERLYVGENTKVVKIENFVGALMS